MSEKNVKQAKKIQLKGKLPKVNLSGFSDNLSVKLSGVSRLITIGLVIKLVLFFTVIASLFVFVTLIYRTAVEEEEVKGPIKTVFPSPSPGELPHSKPSYYATDSAVLKMEADVEQLGQELHDVRLDESELTPPLIDLDIHFKKK